MKPRQDLFTYTINELRYGEAQHDLTQALHECVQAARLTGKAATLTLTLKVEPEGDGQYRLRDDIRTRLPKVAESTLMFGTPDGNLTRHDPRQRDMDLKIVPGEPADPPIRVNEGE